MGERSRHEHGTFSWTDLGTSDAGAAVPWYRDLFGWDTEDSPIPDGGVYTMASLGGRSVAAIYATEQGPPAWLSYVTVDDADAAAARAGELGATLIAEPFDVMEVGRMAVVQDPAGAVFAVWQAGKSIGAEQVNAHGAITLNQLNTSDPPGAERFYTDLFGWRFEAQPGGPPAYWGIYRGDTLNGGMMELPAESPAPPHWLVYFGIDDIDAAAATIEGSGGTLTVPKTDVPGGQIVVAQDPQGAVFALFAGRFDG
ncbi:MAG TPA: VOC family protein [Thermoleophilaceae bacterium]|nr:VOC family protein [Thermoleophilaceae bacterium]